MKFITDGHVNKFTQSDTEIIFRVLQKIFKFLYKLLKY